MKAGNWFRAAMIPVLIIALSSVAWALPTKTPPVTLGAQTLTGSGSSATAYEFFRQSGSSWKGDIGGITFGAVYSLVIEGIDVTGVTGPAGRQIYFNLQDAENGSSYKNLGISVRLQGAGAGGQALLQCYQNFTSDGLSSHGFNAGVLTESFFDLRFDFTKASAGAVWHVTPYYRLNGGAWAMFFGGSFNGLAPFDFVGGKLVVAFDGNPTFAGGTVSFDNYYLSGPPSNTYVDDDWVGYAVGTAVQFPGSTNWHTFGVDAFATIQSGINAVNPGGTVNVAAGLSPYFEHDIAINKAQTLIGDPGGAQPGPGANAPIVDGQNLYHYGFLFGSGANHVTISGFEIRNYVGPENGDGDAFQAWYHSTDHVTITDNYMHHLESNGVLVGSDGLEAQHSYWTVARNVLENFGPPAFGNDQGYGLEFTNTSNSVIEDNIVHAGTGYPAMGIRVSGRFAYQSSITVRNNEVRGAYERCAIQVNAYDIEAPNATLDGVTIEHNDIEIGHAPRVLYLRDDYSGGTAVLTNVVIHNNRLVSTDNQPCVQSLTDQTVDASGNWWGSADPATVATKVGTQVDYTPWCGLVGTSNNPGYTPDLSVLWADDSSPQVPSGTKPIAEALGMVTGSTVNLAPGNYEEQVHITMNGLQLVGAGVGLTTIQSPPALPLTFTTGAVNHPIIFVDGATGVGLSGMTVNGLGRGNANSRFVGIGLWNSGGSVSNVDVTNVRDTPFSGAQHGVAVYVYNNTGGPYTLDMTDVNLTGYQKTGAALSGNGLTVNLTRVTATGVGDALTTAQNGIQISYGATGTLSQCAVSGNCYMGESWAASGYLISQTVGTVSITGSTASGNQANVYADDADVSFTGGQIDYGTSAGADYGVLAYNRSTARANTNHPLPSPVEESYRPRSTVDANQAVSLTNVTLIGDGLADGTGIYGFSVGDNLDMTVTGCDIRGWDYGMILYEYGGTISAAVTGNKLTNHYNAYDNKPGPITGRWAGNCYSDYALNSGFPLGQYDVDDAGNIDFNPNVNGCSNIDVYAPAYIGCAASGCPRDTLYYTLDLDSVVDQRIWVTLPAGFLADWSGLNYPFGAGTGWDPRFFFGMATKLAANRVEIHVGFNVSLGGSTGNPALYVASLPIVNDTVAHCGHKAVQGDSAYSLLIGPSVVSDLLVASATITVDCAPPTGTLAYEPEAPACNAFGAASQLVGKFKAEVFRGDVSCNSPLDEAWLTVNGNTYTFFGANPAGDFSQVFPGSGTLDENTLWSWLVEGCNTLVLHFKDTECNEDSIALANVGKDVTVPPLARSFTQAACYNNEPLSPQYGGGLLDDELDIDASVGTGSCIAQTGTLWFRYDGTANTWPTTPFTLPVADYPDSPQALDLWAWMMTQVPAEASGNYIFWVIAMDCAGNMDSLFFSVCIDLHRPANAFTILDARPTGLGVWLKWAWTYNATDAVEAKIFRSVHTGDYPLYNAPWKWDEFNNDADYEQNYYDASNNWILVATLSSLYQTSGAYPGTHDPGNTYWYYAGNWDTLGADHEYRDVYRFATFVKDVSGNWSQLGSYTAAVNADRSTNYWLGDFSMDVEDDYPGNPESGAVQGYDLSLFTASYFKGSGSGYDPKCDIGPETGFPQGENAIGKGIPMPDDSVNFWDLVPFSFNFYMTGYQSYVTMPSPVTPHMNTHLDAQPVVSVCRTDADPSATSDEFTVTVTLSGNTDNAVKGVEAHVTFDPAALEFVSAVSGDISVSDGGQLFAVARPVNGSNRMVGVAAAACGPIATLNGDLALALLTFRWKAGHNAEAELALDAVRMFDAYGTVLNGAGSVLSVGTAGVPPVSYALYQNYPNPFNPATQIRFDLKQTGDVSLVIYNVMGQEVRTLLSKAMEAGQHAVAWDGTDQHGRTVGSGVYVYRLKAGSFVESRKMLLTR